MEAFAVLSDVGFYLILEPRDAVILDAPERMVLTPVFPRY